jgi:hypothetical protein
MYSLQKMTCDRLRPKQRLESSVARMELGNYLWQFYSKIVPIAQLGLFFHGSRMYNKIRQKWIGLNFGHFFASSSGHPTRKTPFDVVGNYQCNECKNVKNNHETGAS